MTLTARLRDARIAVRIGEARLAELAHLTAEAEARLVAKRERLAELEALGREATAAEDGGVAPVVEPSQCRP